jgi:hypothetical protein
VQMQSFMEQWAAGTIQAITELGFTTRDNEAGPLQFTDEALSRAGENSFPARSVLTGENTQNILMRGRLETSAASIDRMILDYDIGELSDERVTHEVQELEDTLERLRQSLDEVQRERTQSASLAARRYR